MKKLGRIVLILVLMTFITTVFTACGNDVESIQEERVQEEQTQGEEKTQEEIQEEQTQEETTPVSMDENYQMGDESDMKLYINDQEIPVIWEDNETVLELMEQAANSDITVQMSMYSDNEQVGPLGKDYTRDDKQTTTHNGDIVLYSGNQIVVFYGSNSWAYTRLGKMDIPQDEVNELLSNGDVELKLSCD
ncbi:MAG: hypothetical protein K2K96_04095 [Lachnospiraceae bacterium]|nr:hypothetical protein [Lachnospiraceae bacterium]